MEEQKNTVPAVSETPGVPMTARQAADDLIKFSEGEVEFVKLVKDGDGGFELTSDKSLHRRLVGRIKDIPNIVFNALSQQNMRGVCIQTEVFLKPAYHFCSSVLERLIQWASISHCHDILFAFCPGPVDLLPLEQLNGKLYVERYFDARSHYLSISLHGMTVSHEQK